MSLHDLAEQISLKALNLGLLAPYAGRHALRDLVLQELAAAGLGHQVATESRERLEQILEPDRLRLPGLTQVELRRARRRRV